MMARGARYGLVAAEDRVVEEKLAKTDGCHIGLGEDRIGGGEGVGREAGRCEGEDKGEVLFHGWVSWISTSKTWR